MSIGSNLRAIRENKAISQRQLADAVFVSPSMICQIERGTKALNLELAKPIVEVLGCAVDDLFAQAGGGGQA